MPFERRRSGKGAQLRWLVNRLEQCGSEAAVIDPCRHQRQPRRTVAINYAIEPKLAGGGKTLWMLDGQHPLGPAIALLLTKVRADGWTAMVPNHGCRSKTDLIALLQKSPANVDIIAGLTKLPIKAAERNQHAPTESHVATGHVLGRLVVEHNMARIARTVCDAFRNPVVISWTEVRPANGIDALLEHAMS